MTVWTNDEIGGQVWSDDEGQQETVLDQLAASDGSSLIGFVQSGTGATNRTVQAKLREIEVSITDFGAVAGADSTTAVTNAIASGAKVLRVPHSASGDYLISSQVNINTDITFVGDGKYASGFKKTFNGDMFLMGASAGFYNVHLDGNRGTYTGRNVIISAGNSQWFENFRSVDSESYDIEYTTADAGSMSWIADSQLGGRGTHTAVKYPTDTTATPRSIINCQGGGSILIDFGGAQDVFFAHNFTNGMTFSSSALAVGFIIGNRIATGGGTTTIDGGEIHLVGNDFAGPVVLAATSAAIVLAANVVPASNVTNSGTANLILTSANLDMSGTLTVRGAGPHSIAGNTTVTGTTGVALTVAQADAIQIINSSTGTNRVRLRFTNTSGNLEVGLDNSTANGIFTGGGSTAYAAFFCNQAATPILIGHASPELTITATNGNVGVGTGTFGTNAAKVFGLINGTAPTTGPADTVQIYSSDNSAGNTIPSFFCEGTEVIATGQADSASSVRVKMRINGTVVTLLAI